MERTEGTDNESVEEFSDAGQAFMAARVEGVKDASDHPELPAHTHNEYGCPDDALQARACGHEKSLVIRTSTSPRRARLLL